MLRITHYNPFKTSAVLPSISPPISRFSHIRDWRATKVRIETTGNRHCGIDCHCLQPLNNFIFCFVCRDSHVCIDRESNKANSNNDRNLRIRIRPKECERCPFKIWTALRHEHLRWSTLLIFKVIKRIHYMFKPERCRSVYKTATQRSIKVSANTAELYFVI